MILVWNITFLQAIPVELKIFGIYILAGIVSLSRKKTIWTFTLLYVYFF